MSVWKIMALRKYLVGWVYEWLNWSVTLVGNILWLWHFLNLSSALIHKFIPADARIYSYDPTWLQMNISIDVYTPTTSGRAPSSYCYVHFDGLLLRHGPHQANLVLIAYASSEGSGEPAHPRSLARTSAARSNKQGVKRNLQTESQIPGPSKWLGMRSWNLSWRNARRHKFAWRGSLVMFLRVFKIAYSRMRPSTYKFCNLVKGCVGLYGSWRWRHRR